MSQKNLEIRKAIEEAGLYYWQVALHYGLNDGNFSRLLRRDLKSFQHEKIMMIIEEIKNAQRLSG